MAKAPTVSVSATCLLAWLSLIPSSSLASDQATLDSDDFSIGAGLGIVSIPQNINALDTPLLSETNSTISINGFKAPVRLVFFGFTYCPDICPLTLHKVASALRLLNRPAEDVDVIFISVDPKRDTPDILARYTDAFHEQITGLSGDPIQLQEITQHFHTTFGYNLPTDNGDQPVPVDEYDTLPVDSNYVPYHSSQIYVLDLNGEIIDLIGLGSDAKLIAQTIENAINQ